MERLVFCRKYQKQLVGLDGPPYPGPKGQEIYENVSKKAWQDWLNHQTMLINEGQLNLTEKTSRIWLKEQMDLFLSNENYVKPKGYTPKD